VRGSDLQDVGTVLGQGAGTGRAGEHAGQVEDADARQGPVALGLSPQSSEVDLDAGGLIYLASPIVGFDISELRR
jgi:hypothetical protein